MARGRTGFPRKEKLWQGLSIGTQALTGDGTSAGSGSLVFLATGTIMRMIGEYIIGPSAAVAAGDGVVISVGIGVFSADAVAAGAASLPDPNDEPEYPWLYRLSHALFFPAVVTEPQSGQSYVRHGFDVKSMRKVKPQEALVAVVQYANFSGNPPIEFVMAPTRVLIAES